MQCFRRTKDCVYALCCITCKVRIVLSNMGVLNFYKLVAKHAPDAARDLTLSDLHESRVGIDAPMLVHRAVAACGENAPQYIADKLLLLLGARLDLVMVFDGDGNDIAKELERARRSEQRKLQESRAAELERRLQEDAEDQQEMEELRRSIKRLRDACMKPDKILYNMLVDICNEFHIPCIHASGEAERHLAMLSRAGMIDYVVTEDSDSLINGAKCIITFSIAKLDKLIISINCTSRQHTRCVGLYLLPNENVEIYGA